LGVIMIFFGLAFEMSAAPFHAWAPNAYQGAPTPISALLAGASKKMAFAAAFKILSIVITIFKVELGVIIALLAILSMIVGNILALGQKDVKRMLAYSSIAQVGYILASIAIFTPFGIAYALYYILVHAFMKCGAFIAAASAYFSSNGKIKEYDDYKGLYRKMPLTSLFMAGFLFSLAGIVPFGGFTAKILILIEIFIEYIKGSIIALILGLTMIITSVISLYYYGRLIKYMWFVESNNENNEHKVEKLKENLTFVIPMAIAFIALLIMFYPTPFVDIGIEIAKNLGF
ncbi:MAG: NADH-quinone oxidoreductase subunit N, partial [Candidatus Altarchaeaceae archaeon]